MADVVKTVSNTAAVTGQKGNNPYEYYYREHYGYIFGRPLAFNLKADPHQRIYQRTMLKNSTVINIIPGVAKTDNAMLDKAKGILEAHAEAVSRIETSYQSNKQKMAGELAGQAAKTQDKLLSNGCDLRYFTFEQKLADFKLSYQLMLQRTGAAIFGWTRDNISRMTTDAFDLSVTEDVLKRGFKVWVEKATTVSESVENSFTQSILEAGQKKMSNAARQIKFMGGTVGILNGDSGTTSYEGGNQSMQDASKMSDILSRSVSGAVMQFPQIYDDSKFSRSYDISFRFISPYGDDRSIYYNVITPFLFLLTCAMPRQDGVSGYTSPYLLQIDAPGYFACPMGVITSFSFNKGGDEKMFNSRGLPLIIEGSFSVTDLYSNLSMPTDYNQFATNIGTAAFLNNLAGLSLYATIDPSVAKMAIDYTTSVLTKVTYPFSKINEEVNKVRRFLGMT